MRKPTSFAPKLDSASLTQRFQEAGFAVRDQSGRIRVVKDGYAAELQMSPSGEPRFAACPGLLLGDEILALVDCGFQKFWQNARRRIPALANQLKGLHAFREELAEVLKATTLYNEALGTVSSRYVYDRVEGRERPKRHTSFD